MSKSALVPKLRFPEFREAGKWEIKQLAKICDLNPASSKLPVEFYYIDLESVEEGELKARKMIRREEAPSRAQRLLKVGDVIYQIVRPYQKNNYFFKIEDGHCYVASTGYAQLRAFESKDFLFQLVHTDTFVERVIAKCTGSNYPAINSSDLAEIPVIVPNSDEQQKIADCLSSLDELIAAEGQKLDILKTHKKGLMQQLFPREGETAPRLRFPEFREAGKWEKKTLADVCLRITNGKANAEDHEDDGIYPLYDRSEFVKKSNKFAFDDEAVIIPGEGQRFQPKYHKGKFNLHQRAYALIQHQGDARFVYYALDRFKDTLAKNAVKSTVLSLRLPIIERFSLAIPRREEQQKIADCLSSLDELIAAEDQKLDTLKTHKKGLMQQLFPALDKVSA